jgi:hypothetical protein
MKYIARCKLALLFIEKITIFHVPDFFKLHDFLQPTATVKMLELRLLTVTTDVLIFPLTPFED